MVGATDRFNYGDLLFPHITKRVLTLLGEKHGDSLDIVNVSTISKKCSKWGGIDTKSMSTIHQYERRKINHSIVVVGGGVLAVDWLSLYSMVSPFYYLLHKYRRYGKRWMKYIKRPREKYPFFWNRVKNKYLDNVCYLSVGDTCDAEMKFVNEAIENADYFTVRTKYSKDLIDKKYNVGVVPDTAILMSSLFQKDIGGINLSIYTKGESYIFFQISLRLLNEIGNDTIVKELEKVQSITKSKILLCSIGTALRHTDDKALSIVSSKLKAEHILVNKENIWVIMDLIANSQMYIGSSLHGLITAMSFGVPYVGFEEISKQKHFIESWSIDELKESVSASSFSNKAIEVYNLKDELKCKIKQQTKLLKTKVYRSYIELYSRLQ